MAQSRSRAAAQPQDQAGTAQKCLRAANGACTNPRVVEAARLRAIVIPSMAVSYYGTPAGAVGGRNIPLERIFRDDVTVYGLPTDIYLCGVCILRSK